jgi:hypothetical protein
VSVSRAVVKIVVSCDQPGCTNTLSTWRDRVRDARHDAKSDGWAYARTLTGPNHDFCPKHSRAAEVTS